MKKYLLCVVVAQLALAQNASAQSTTQNTVQNTAQKLLIVSSIAPIHALLVELTIGVQKPRLLLSPKTMPHGARLKPSQARLLNQAQLLVLVGSNFASFEKNIKQSESRKVVRLTQLPGIKKIRYRKTKQHKKAESEHDEHEHAESGEIDPHVWLNPQNARVIVAHLAKELGYLDQVNREVYLQNAKRLDANLQKLDLEIAKNMRGLAGKFLVLHDATAYFVERYKIQQQENLYAAAHNATRNGARHSLTVRKKLREGKYQCVLVQAQAPQEVRARSGDWLFAAQSKNGKNTKVIEINPLGAMAGEHLLEGSDYYADLLLTIAQAFQSCLGRN